VIDETIGTDEISLLRLLFLLLIPVLLRLIGSDGYVSLNYKTSRYVHEGGYITRDDSSSIA
jgi:hypothetical protein